MADILCLAAIASRRVYVGFSVGQSKTDSPSDVDDFFDETSNGFKLFLGILFLDVATFDLFAKAGLVQWDARLTADTFFGPIDEDDTGTDFAWRAGAQARFGSLAVRAEYERFEIDEADGLIGKPEMFSVGVSWTFF